MKLGIVFDVKNSRFKSEVKESTQVIQKLGTSHQVAAGKSRQLSNELTNTEQKLFRTNKVAQAVTLSLASMATGFSVGLLFKNLSDTTQKFQVLRATLETATGGVDEAGQAFDRLQVFASKTPFSVEESIQAFIKLKNLGLDPTETALNSYGNTASAMGKSLDQFIEAVADASVSEFERLKEFGIKAKNQGDTIAFTFRKMTTEVGNNAEAIEQYLQNLGENEFAGAMERQAATYDGALSNMGDAWDRLLLKISDDGAGDAMENVIRGITSKLTFLGENTQEVADIFEFGLVVATGHAVNAVLSKSAALKKDILATQSSNKATLALAKTELSQAQTANLRAIQEQAAAQRMLKNAQNATIRSKAITNLARANGQLAASEKLVALATNNVAIATNKANIARRAGAAALGLLGGPAGVAMLAAYAIGSYAMSAADAARESVNLADKIGLADKKLTELSTKQLNLRLFNLDNDPAAEIDKARLRALKAQEEYNKVQAKRGFKNPNNETDKTVLNRDVEIEALEAKLAKTKELKEKIKELLATPSSSSVPGTESPEQDPKSLDVFAQQEAALTRQLSLLGQTTQLAKAEYETTLGKYKELLPGQKAALLNLAQEIDDKNKALAADKESVNQAKELKSTADSYANSLQRKAELTSESSNVAQLNYEIEHGSLKGINDELRIHLGLLAQKADVAANDSQFNPDDKGEQRALELAQLQGFNSLEEQENAEHEDRKMEVKTRKTGQLQGTLMQFSNWEKKNAAEKTSAVIGLGEKGFAAMAGQSKKAFAAYKAFSIAQALIKTYEGATSAYSAMASIPYVGPALGIAAAGVAVAMGISQVNAIKSQKPQGFATGGRIGQGQNVIEFGESNDPEVLEFGGQNYLLNGNGGAVFNRSQLQPVGGSSTTGDGISSSPVHISTSIEVHGQMSEDQQAELIERNSEAVYAAYVRAKNDRGEAA